MKDFNGNELKLNDYVIYVIANNNCARLHKGFIRKLTEKTAFIQEENDKYGILTRKSGNYIIKYDGDREN